MSHQRISAIAVVVIACAILLSASMAAAYERQSPTWERQLDRELAAALRAANFTGQIEATLEQRIGHRIDHQLADRG